MQWVGQGMMKKWPIAKVCRGCGRWIFPGEYSFNNPGPCCSPGCQVKLVEVVGYPEVEEEDVARR
jgi:hypothetical protein